MSVSGGKGPLPAPGGPRYCCRRHAPSFWRRLLWEMRGQLPVLGGAVAGVLAGLAVLALLWWAAR